MQLHLFTANPDGTDVRQITEGPYQDHRPSFRPDGEWLVFASNRSGETAIWRVPAEGGQEPEPVFIDHWGYRPWYTPDGSSVLFYGPDGNRHRISNRGGEMGIWELPLRGAWTPRCASHQIAQPRDVRLCEEPPSDRGVSSPTC